MAYDGSSLAANRVCSIVLGCSQLQLRLLVWLNAGTGRWGRIGDGSICGELIDEIDIAQGYLTAYLLKAPGPFEFLACLFTSHGGSSLIL